VNLSVRVACKTHQGFRVKQLLGNTFHRRKTGIRRRKAKHTLGAGTIRKYARGGILTERDERTGVNV
jgi:hypothetical protein